MKTFKGLGLSEEITRSILDAGYTTPTAVQAEAIPIAMAGRDLIGSAQTGTGKTAAFVLPMLSRLTQSRHHVKGRPIRALVVAPTRELAMQVEQAIRVYGKHSRLRSLSVYGGTSMGAQLQNLRRGVDIVVATPGRLLDHMNRGSVNLSKVEILVLDEADRMLDMGFLPDIRKIIDAAPKDRQTLLFSATMPKPLQVLAKTVMNQPEVIQIGEHRNPADTVYQQVCMVPNAQKMDLLLHVLQSETMNNVIIFSRTKHRADRISKKLGQSGFSATVMHSNRTQGQRQKALAGFKNGQFQFLVATDIAARGIDVDSISHVINFDTPHQAEDYIHRIGRTGRAETTGEAITFVGSEEVSNLRQIERHTGQKLDRKTYDDFQLGAVSEQSSGGDNRRGPSRRNGSTKARSGGQRSRGGNTGGGQRRQSNKSGGSGGSGGRYSRGSNESDTRNSKGDQDRKSDGSDTRGSSGPRTRNSNSSGTKQRTDASDGRRSGNSARSTEGGSERTNGNGSARRSSGSGTRGAAKNDTRNTNGGRSRGSTGESSDTEQTGQQAGAKKYRSKPGKPYAKKAKRGRKKVAARG